MRKYYTRSLGILASMLALQGFIFIVTAQVATGHHQYAAVLATRSAGNQWTGIYSSAWGDGRNWFTDSVPTGTSDVSVPVTGRNPIISGNTAVRNIYIAAGATVIMSNAMLTVNGNVTGTGTFAGVSSSGLTLAFEGDIGTLYFAVQGINSLILTGNSATATLGNATNITGELNIGSATLNTADNLTLKSTINGTAWLAPVNGGSVTGNVTVERYIPQNAFRAWRLLSVQVHGTQTFHQAWQENQPPLVNGTPGYGTLLTNNPGNNGYDTATPGNSLLSFISGNPGSFLAVNNTNYTMATVGGYFVYIRGDRGSAVSTSTFYPTATTLRTNGLLNIGTQLPINLPTGQNVVVGNIYAAPIDFARLTKSGITSFKIWDPKLRGTYNIGGYQTFSATNGYDPIPGGGSYGSTPNSIIESGQAFMANSPGGGFIQMTEAAKATGSRNVFKMPKAKQELKINLYAITSSGKQLADGASIVFGDQFSNNVDTDDALKANNFGENIAIHTQSTLLSLEARKNVVADNSASLNIWNLKQQQYSMDIVINAPLALH